jgi:hypothetical protein
MPTSHGISRRVASQRADSVIAVRKVVCTRSSATARPATCAATISSSGASRSKTRPSASPS